MVFMCLFSVYNPHSLSIIKCVLIGACELIRLNMVIRVFVPGCKEIKLIIVISFLISLES